MSGTTVKSSIDKMLTNVSEEDGDVWLSIVRPGSTGAGSRITPGEAVTLSRALVKAAAEALGVSV